MDKMTGMQSGMDMHAWLAIAARENHNHTLSWLCNYYLRSILITESDLCMHISQLGMHIVVGTYQPQRNTS
jgi:hypothetical protein